MVSLEKGRFDFLACETMACLETDVKVQLGSKVDEECVKQVHDIIMGK